jgi:hypothetical protein
MGTGPCTGFHGSKKLNARTCSGSVNPEQVQSFFLAMVMICLQPAKPRQSGSAPLHPSRQRVTLNDVT